MVNKIRTREDLRIKLAAALGSDHIYYQPPGRLEYPCIVYEKADYDIKYANDIKYAKKVRYTVTFIHRDPDDIQIINNILNFNYCSYNRRFISDNLYHDVFDLYW